MSQQRDDSTIENAAKREIEKELEVLAKHMQSLLVAQYVKSIKKFVEMAQGETSVGFNQGTPQMLDQFITRSLGISPSNNDLGLTERWSSVSKKESVSQDFTNLNAPTSYEKSSVDNDLIDEMKEWNQELDVVLKSLHDLVGTAKQSLTELQTIRIKLPDAPITNPTVGQVASAGGASDFKFFAPTTEYLTRGGYDKVKARVDKEKAKEEKSAESKREVSKPAVLEDKSDRKSTSTDSRVNNNGQSTRRESSDDDDEPTPSRASRKGKPKGFKIPKGGLAGIGIEAAILTAQYAASVTDQRLQRASRTKADNYADDVTKAIELGRMELNTQNSGNWLDKVSGFFASKAKRADNDAIGNEVNSIADRMKSQSRTVEEFDQAAARESAEYRRRKAEEEFNANIKMPFLFNGKGEIIKTRHSAMTTMEEAEVALNTPIKQFFYDQNIRNMQGFVDREGKIKQHGKFSDEVLQHDKELVNNEITALNTEIQNLNKDYVQLPATSVDPDARRVYESQMTTLKAQVAVEENKLDEIDNAHYQGLALDEEEKIDRTLNKDIHKLNMDRLRFLNAGHREDSNLIGNIDSKISQKLISSDKQKEIAFEMVLNKMVKEGKQNTDAYRFIDSMRMGAIAQQGQEQYEQGKNKNNQIVADSSYEMRQENRNLQIETNKKDTKILNLLALGVREDSKEIADIQQQFYKMTLESLKNMKRISENAIKDLKNSDIVDQEKLRQEELNLSGIEENIASTNLAMKEDPLQRAKADADYKFKMDLNGVTQKYTLEQQKAMLQGHASNSALVTLLGKQQQLASIESIDKAIQDYKLIQKSYDANHDKYKEFQQQIDALEIQKNSIKLDLKREQLAKSLDTFNLPKDIQPMSYYEALTDKGTHSSYGISMGDTHVSIVVGNVDSDKRVSEVASAVTQAVGGQYRPTISQQLATDSKRIS